jgi:hypothetical protein
VVLLALSKQSRGRGAGRVEGQIFVENGLHVGGRLCGRLVSKGAGFQLGENCEKLETQVHDALTGCENSPLSLSMAHCSNCSSVMSAVGGSE